MFLSDPGPMLGASKSCLGLPGFSGWSGGAYADHTRDLRAARRWFKLSDWMNTVCHLTDDDRRKTVG